MLTFLNKHNNVNILIASELYVIYGHVTAQNNNMWIELFSMLFMFEDFNLRLFFNQLKVIEKENNLFMLNYLKKKNQSWS